MAKRKIVWTRNAEIQLQGILEFYIARNKSSVFSRKLYYKFVTELEKVSSKPEIGIKTKLNNIRGLIIGDYILFYEILTGKIMVLKVWDCRQNPGKLNKPR
jgi:plasmid stabilization system protein ParE